MLTKLNMRYDFVLSQQSSLFLTCFTCLSRFSTFSMDSINNVCRHQISFLLFSRSIYVMPFSLLRMVHWSPTIAMSFWWSTNPSPSQELGGGVWYPLLQKQFEDRAVTSYGVVVLSEIGPSIVEVFMCEAASCMLLSLRVLDENTLSFLQLSGFCLRGIENFAGSPSQIHWSTSPCPSTCLDFLVAVGV